MKSFIVFCAVVAFVSADWVAPTKEEVMKNREECLKSENVPEVDIEKLKNRQYDLEFSKEANCYIRCLAVKNGIWDDATGYDADKSLQTLENSGLVVSMENLKKCIQPNTDNIDACTWAAKDLKCLWTNKYISKKA